MNKLLRFGSIFLLCLTSLSSFAQTNYLGVYQSNYAGVMGIENQPASFVDGRYKFDMTLVGLNVGVWQDLKYFDTDAMPGGWRKSLLKDTAWMDDSLLVDNYTGNLYDWNDPNTKTRSVFINTQVEIFSFAFQIKAKQSFGLSMKSRFISNANDLSPKLAKLSEEGLDFSDLWNLELNDPIINANIFAWNEIGVNYGRVLKDDNQHFMKAGITIKALQGLASAFVYTDNLVYKLDNKDTTLTLKGGFDYGYSDGIDALSEAGSTKESIDVLKKSPWGVGVDLGFVYEFRKNPADFKYDMDGKTNLWKLEKNKYDFRLGVALLDFGGVKFKKGGLSRNFTVDMNVPFNLQTFDTSSISGFDYIIDSLIKNNPGWVENENAGETYFMNLPTALSLQADYHIWKPFYVNLTAHINLLGKNVVSKVSTPTVISLTPSFDHSWFGVHFPMSYSRISNFRFGFATRLGPLTIGLVDLKSVLAIGKIRGTQFYMGLRMPIPYMAPDDRDNDKVSDKMDECIDVPGIWEFKGCPDSDKDGIVDAEDACPNDPGTAEFKGCPDRDGDKIIDKDDQCPDVPGVIYFQGCPDVDKDSVMDLKDDCPEIAGKIALNGCPDRDDDGLRDLDDLCPDNAGPISNQGCPDTDNDGIFDFIDNCPTEFGPKENNGCPWPDTDGDGLIDKDDECPNLAGPLKNKGCPYVDTDKDGILDKDDDCPTVPGIPENKGCPKIEKVEQEILNTAFENLEFNTGNAIIKTESYASLDELAKLLVKKPTWKLKISGHTDNQGDDAKNMVLSKQRAEAVKAYLVSKGVDASRLKTEFFGETKPIATNDTPEGRQKNRRVEMKVIFE